VQAVVVEEANSKRETVATCHNRLTRRKYSIQNPTMAVQEETTTTYTQALAPTLLTTTTQRLDSFVVLHGPHRPLALVSSGGTAVDLEQNTVRTLENFSTGWRGAVAVEGLLRKGYAVIHLQRQGSTSPFARVLVEECGGTGAVPHQGLTLETMDRLVVRAQDDNGDYDTMFSTTDQTSTPSDPWMVDAAHQPQNDWNDAGYTENNTSSEVSLRRTLSHSSRLQKALRERSSTRRLLLTINFRTVQEYLGLLQLCAQALQESVGSQALMLLAAAVSDFYLPNPVEHKIQSRSTEALTLQLQAVPKVLGTLQKTWAPDVFVVSFKLETDATILKQKAQQAMQKYGVRMVVGNLLQTRYEQVHLLLSQEEWIVLDKPPCSGENNREALEDLLLQAVIEGHFLHMSGRPPTISKKLQDKQKRMVAQKWWERGQQVFLEAAGIAVSLVLSYAINKIVFGRSKLLS
jgi:phosphopantothenate-cysteine ligase